MIAIHDAGSIAVCRQGDKVAIHIYTPHGEVLVHASERIFMRGCRGPLDANGNAFRSLDEVDPEKRREIEAATLPPPESESRPGRKPDPEVQAKCLRAWEIYLADPSGTIGSAARAAGVPYPTFSEWARHARPGEAERIRGERWAAYRERRRAAKLSPP